MLILIYKELKIKFFNIFWEKKIYKNSIIEWMVNIFMTKLCSWYLHISY